MTTSPHIEVLSSLRNNEYIEEIHLTDFRHYSSFENGLTTREKVWIFSATLRSRPHLITLSFGRSFEPKQQLTLSTTIPPTEYLPDDVIRRLTGSINLNRRDQTLSKPYLVAFGDSYELDDSPILEELDLVTLHFFDDFPRSLEVRKITEDNPKAISADLSIIYNHLDLFRKSVLDLNTRARENIENVLHVFSQL